MANHAVDHRFCAVSNTFLNFERGPQIWTPFFSLIIYSLDDLAVVNPAASEYVES